MNKIKIKKLKCSNCNSENEYRIPDIGISEVTCINCGKPIDVKEFQTKLIFFHKG